MVGSDDQAVVTGGEGVLDGHPLPRLHIPQGQVPRAVVVQGDTGAVARRHDGVSGGADVDGEGDVGLGSRDDDVGVRGVDLLVVRQAHRHEQRPGGADGAPGEHGRRRAVDAAAHADDEGPSPGGGEDVRQETPPPVDLLVDVDVAPDPEARRSRSAKHVRAGRAVARHRPLPVSAAAATGPPRQRATPPGAPPRPAWHGTRMRHLPRNVPPVRGRPWTAL
jgi:hypothetical protein